MDTKERRALAAERARKRRLALVKEAHEAGVEDIEGYVQAVTEAEDGGPVDDMPDDPFLPPGQSLH